MKITTVSHPERRVTVIRLEGLMTLSGGHFWAGFLRGYHESVILDLAGVSSLDSTGLGELMGVFSVFHRAGRSLVLLNPRKIVDILTVTTLLHWFTVFDDEQKALESFSLVAT